jgi:hypothetical protein
MHNLTTLYDAVNVSLNEIDMQIKHVKNDIARDYPEDQRDKINVWYWTRHTDGTYVLADLLVARARCLAAMAELRVEMSASRRKR